jgi:hypothetical protein
MVTEPFVGISTVRLLRYWCASGVMIALLAGCGGSDGGSSTPGDPPPPPPVNQAPQVSAGDDAFITLPESLSLAGEASDDGLPDSPGSLTLAWVQVSGPGTASFDTPDSAACAVWFDAPGDYVLRLTATDGLLASSDDVAVEVAPAIRPNAAPIVSAGPDRTLQLPGALNLAGTVEDDGLPDPPGEVTLQWSQVSETGDAVFSAPTELATAVSFDGDGTYVLRLTANDSELSGSDELKVTVQTANRSPSLAPTGGFSIPEASQNTIEVSASDPDPGELRFTVEGLPDFAGFTDNGDGTARIAFNPGYEDSGSYVVTITVTDDGSPPLSDDSTFTVTVTDVNRPPVLDAITDRAVVAGDTVVVPVSAADPDGDTVNFSSPDLPAFVSLAETGIGTAELRVSPGSGDVIADLAITIDASDDVADSLTDRVVFRLTVLERRSRTFSGIVAYYPFRSGAGSVVIDEAGNGDPLDLAITGNVSWLPDINGVRLEGGGVGSEGPASKIIDQLRLSGASSCEIWAKSANATQGGPARLISLAASETSENIMLGQEAADLEVRLLHTGKAPDASPRLAATDRADAGAAMHLVHTFDGQVERLYINGLLYPKEITAQGTFGNWEPTAIFEIGNRAALDRPFFGEVYLVAVYDRALSLDDVQRNYSAGASPNDAVKTTTEFRDITTAAGVAGLSTFGGHGIQFMDVDKDSLVDFYVTRNFEPTDMADLFYHNNGDGTFDEEAALRRIENFDTGSHGGVWADFDNDGDLDLFNGSYDQNRLYRTNGRGFFLDVTANSGFPSQSLPTRGVIAFDMDADGDLDIFAVSNSSGSNDPPGEFNEVYRNNGGLSFTPVAAGDLESAPAGQGAVAVDFDNDGDLDVFAGNRTGPVNVLRNRGNGVFDQVSPASIGLDREARDGISFADIDNDGRLDLLLNKHLFRATGNGQFTFVRTFESATNHYMGGFADLDNDGDFDLAFPGRNYVYLNDGSGSFSPSTAFAIGTINDPRCVAFGDIDNDGDLDIAYAQKRRFNLLVRNDLQSTNHWIKVGLRRASGQAGAFGARIFVYEPGGLGDSARRIIWTEQTGAYGYLAQNDPLLHFGVGNFGSVDLRVVFPGGSTVDFRDVATNTVHILTE